MDTNIMLEVLHLPKTDTIEELSILQLGWLLGESNNFVL